MATKHPKIDLRLGPDTDLDAMYQIASRLLYLVANRHGQVLSVESDPMTITLTLDLTKKKEPDDGDDS